MALKISRREQEGISIRELTGRLTFGQEDIAMNDEIRHALAARRNRVVVDLGGVDKMDSAGLGTLLYARAELRRAGGGLALCNLRANHMHVLLVSKLETVFDIFENQQEAIDSLLEAKGARHPALVNPMPAREHSLHTR